MKPAAPRHEAHSGSGILSERSTHSVDETVERIKSFLSTKGINLFALIDHSGEAAKVGLQLRPTKLLVFGNPAAGTPLMQSSPTAGLDLPMKILVWQDDDATVWMSYNDPAYFAERYGLSASLLAPVQAVETLVHASA